MRSHEKWVQGILFILATTAVLTVLAITFFIFSEGLPIMVDRGVTGFIGSTRWEPLSGSFGILGMIIGTIQITLGAIALGVPVGLACAVYLAEIADRRLEKILRPGIELLAGIPSVVYGFFGLSVVVPFLREHFPGNGFSILAGSIILAIMILPTVVNISENSIRSVPGDYRSASLALGASHWQTILRVILPAARSGIAASVILGMGRAIGETMAVIMVTGNVTKVAGSIFDPARTLTGNIAIEMGYAAGEHREALFATGVILFLIIMVLNFSTTRFSRKAGDVK
ncbi:MAG: phosphate ABC transporter permease subunit PstC [Bacillota bacterium]|nr:phosphate ABC transporter permease subunit PstC [Bacillota bacterium]MDD3298052.1 phosphate ABC transporter permease subunit PstC [Bacillota bacterium]MDD3850502.1 phosphate ABC transporter permease subunit PstC [Bacillota bacterium]MDD4707732.1 phosphate ABC transporter permease subunit PstC [Bacillota bacterium]